MYDTSSSQSPCLALEIYRACFVLGYHASEFTVRNANKLKRASKLKPQPSISKSRWIDSHGVHNPLYLAVIECETTLASLTHTKRQQRQAQVSCELRPLFILCHVSLSKHVPTKSITSIKLSFRLLRSRISVALWSQACVARTGIIGYATLALSKFKSKGLT